MGTVVYTTMATMTYNFTTVVHNGHSGFLIMGHGGSTEFARTA